MFLGDKRSKQQLCKLNYAERCVTRFHQEMKENDVTV